MLELVWTRSAAAELQHAVTWYREHNKRAAKRFAAAVESAVLEIAGALHRFASIGFGCRRANVLHLPYGLIYKVENHRGQDRVLVLPCFHGKRNPLQWQTRIT